MSLIIAFAIAHKAALSAVGVAILDLAIEMNPKLQANSIISLLLSSLKKKAQ